uniref:Uncharacterized protein n=1 Tax=Glossina pallidipes TaxID=7398 RepID=A0A1B0AEY8_GLOPL
MSIVLLLTCQLANFYLFHKVPIKMRSLSQSLVIIKSSPVPPGEQTECEQKLFFSQLYKCYGIHNTIIELSSHRLSSKMGGSTDIEIYYSSGKRVKNGLLADNAGLVRLAASFAVLYANVFMPANVKIANDFCLRHSVYEYTSPHAIIHVLLLFGKCKTFPISWRPNLGNLARKHFRETLKR